LQAAVFKSQCVVLQNIVLDVGCYQRCTNFKISTVHTRSLYHSQQRYHFNGTEKWRNAGLFGLPCHSYVAVLREVN